jgi:hypothetical protein
MASPMGGMYLDIDMYKIDQVIKTLIVNAIKHSPAKGSISVRITCTLLDDYNRSHVVAKVRIPFLPPSLPSSPPLPYSPYFTAPRWGWTR